MNYFRHFLILVFLLLVQMSSFGQSMLPSFKSQATHENQLLIRWEPRDLAEWQHSLENGYQVKVYEGKSQGNLLLKRTESIKALPFSEWDQVINEQQDTLLRSFYEGARNLIYMEKEVKEEVMKSLVAEEGKTKEESVNEFQLGYLLYTITYGYDIINKAGLGYSLQMNPGSFYRIEVQTGNYDNFVFDYAPDNIVQQTIPELNAEFGNKKVNVKWKTPEFKDQYYGYYLTVSKNGRKFTMINDVPYVNILVSLQGESKFQYINEDIELDRNYKNYWFRLKGMNYFGIQSTLSSIRKGYGFDVIDAMPIIHHSEQSLDNHADIRWRLDSKFNRLVDHFEIHRADELEGEYVSVYDSIPVNHRTVRVPIENNRNFFSVVIVPKDGETIRSFAVFIMGQDTVAPIIPQNFIGNIDSLGIVHLEWNKNQEEDLWGYKVYRTEYLVDEMAVMHDSPILDTFFIDTVNLQSINDQIHYSVIAIDKRNNRSDFAPIISLERPDTIPPDPPLIRTVEFLEDSIKIMWGASSSKDVKIHQLYRKEISESSWELIAQEGNVRGLRTLIDTSFQLNTSYAYTVIATDKVDLQSKPSRPRTVYTESRRHKQVFSDFEVSFDEEQKTSTIQWEYLDEDLLEEIIVYRGPTKETISMYQIIEPSSNELSQIIEEGEKWCFLFKPVLNNGKRAKVSELIVLENPK